MTIDFKYEFPYPRNVGSVPKIETYLKSLHAALMAFQPKWGEAIESRLLTLLSTHELGWSEIGSNPFIGEYRVKDIRLDSSKQFVIKYDETPLAADTIYDVVDSIKSTPGAGEYAIRALRLDADLKLKILYDETAGAASGYIKSNPGLTEYRIKYIRLDSTKKVIIVYDETPV